MFKNNFKANLPYKIITVSSDNEVKYKITQPLNLWIFGLTQKYYDVMQWYLRERFSVILYFQDKKEVDNFVLREKEKQKEAESVCEIVVFDSTKQHTL